MRSASEFTKNPTSLLELAPGPVGNRRANHDVLLPGVAGEKQLEAGQQSHEECRAFFLPERPQPLQKREGKQQPFRGASAPLDGRPMEVSRQVQDGGSPRELGAPERRAAARTRCRRATPAARRQNRHTAPATQAPEAHPQR